VTRGELDAALIVRPTFALPNTVEWAAIQDKPLILIGPSDMPEALLAQLFSCYRFIRYDRNQWVGRTDCRPAPAR
tara:strand:+ start:97 stop:321 length:225 start_codon:yes stop_codon:yes gene_type:complete